MRDDSRDSTNDLWPTSGRGSIFGPVGEASTRAASGRLLILLVSALLTASAHAQVRVMNWNVARLNGDPVAIEDVFAAAAADDQPGFAVAPAIIVLQEVTESSRPAIENLVQAGVPNYEYATATFTVGS